MDDMHKKKLKTSLFVKREREREREAGQSKSKKVKRREKKAMFFEKKIFMQLHVLFTLSPTACQIDDVSIEKHLVNKPNANFLYLRTLLLMERMTSVTDSHLCAFLFGFSLLQTPKR
jgi:hypothetical protein